jgi:choline dehydrogenase-like flavoprotein
MRLQSEFGVGADWPLAYTELEPYYSVAEALVGVAGPSETGARWRSAPYPLPPHRLCRASERLVAAGRTLGQAWRENPRAALSRAYDGRPPCNYCANCSRGCPLGDKGSADVSFVRHAERSGCTVRENARVLKIETRGRRIVAVRFRVGTQEHRVETPQLLLACGAIETPRLLLDQASRSQPRGLANSAGQIGKNLMETLSWASVGLVEDDLRSWAGLPADAICWDYNHPRAIPGAIGGCRFNSATQELGLTGPIAQATRLVRGFGTNLKAQVRAGFGHALAVGGVAEYLPNPATFVDLDPARRDADGRPLARLHLRLEAGEIARLRFMADTSRKLLAAAGARERVEESSSYDRVAATHVFGTCRMGADGANSVVDAGGRAHDFDNLAIVDASVFPSSGGGESPSLTIQALAIRAADRIALGYFLPPSAAPSQPASSTISASIRPAAT